jgi:hypothetical protein
MDLKWSLIVLFILLNKTVGNFINFKNGYEYIYHFTSDSTIKELDNFQTDAKVSSLEDCRTYPIIIFTSKGKLFFTRNRNQTSSFLHEKSFFKYFLTEIDWFGLFIFYIFQVNFSSINLKTYFFWEKIHRTPLPLKKDFSCKKEEVWFLFRVKKISGYGLRGNIEVKSSVTKWCDFCENYTFFERLIHSFMKINWRNRIFGAKFN